MTTIEQEEKRFWELAEKTGEREHCRIDLQIDGFSKDSYIAMAFGNNGYYKPPADGVGKTITEALKSLNDNLETWLNTKAW